jgi:hypothetical protein
MGKKEARPEHGGRAAHDLIARACELAREYRV